jgi:hypothetical protein
MNSVINRSICVAAASTLALSAAVARGQDTVRIRAAFDHTAQLLSGGSAVRTGGPLGECPLGDVLTLSVKVTHGQTAATGNWPTPHACTGHDQRWELTAHTTGGSRLGPGQATARGTVVITRDRHTIATIRWHRTITLQKSA